MLDGTLSAERLAELRAAHRGAHEKRAADRIKAVVLFATGWRAKHVTEILRADASIVRNQFKRYRQGGIATLRRVGTDASRSSCALDAEQLVS